VVLPARFRAPLEEGCFIVTSRDGSLRVFTGQGFAQEVEKVMRLPDTAPDRRIRRKFSANAEYQRPDKQGRIMVPEHLRQFAGLELGKEVVVYGDLDHVGIWSTERWAADQARTERDYVETEQEVETD
jgi:MraZ protein